jgi:hypothetical protein
MKIRIPALLGLVAALSAPLAAQPTPDELLERCRRSGAEQGRVLHCDVREVRLPATGALRVDGQPNGAVSVRAWEGREVVVRAVVQGRAAEAGRARALVDGVRVRTDGAVTATGPEAGRNEGWSVSFDVLVPARTDLDLQSRNGPVTVSRVEGTLRLSTRNGPVTLDRVAGDVEASATNGPVTVILDGRGWRGNGLAVESMNGPLTVRMPRDYAAHVVGGTTNGPLSTDLPTTGGARRPTGRTLDTQVNGGGRTLRFTTVNGPLTIRRS